MDDYLKLLAQLMQCQAVTADVEAVNKVIGILHEFLSARGLHCTIEQLDGRKILYASTQDTKTPKLLFNAHIDVVPPSEEGQFELKLTDGWIYGRGTGDCQGNAVCIVRALCEASREASVGAIFSSDEETGGKTTQYMVRQGYGAQSLICILDTFCNDGICYAQKGILSVRLTAHGKGGHGSTPWKFDNPIDKLIDGYARLRASWSNPTAEDPWHPSMAATVLEAGAVVNQIPDEASMKLNFRYTEPEQRQKIIDLITQTTGIIPEVIGARDPVSFPSDLPEISLLRTIVEKRVGHKIALNRMNGATDACWFVSSGKPIAIFGARHEGLHAKGERAELASLETYVKVLNDLIGNLG